MVLILFKIWAPLMTLTKIVLSFLILCCLSTMPARADHPELESSIVFSAHWFSQHCPGIITTEVLEERIKGVDLSHDATNRLIQSLSNRFQKQWKQNSQQQNEALCFRSLVFFGPNGKKYIGLLTATPEYRNKLPLDIKKDLGF